MSIELNWRVPVNLEILISLLLLKIFYAIRDLLHLYLFLVLLQLYLGRASDELFLLVLKYLIFCLLGRYERDAGAIGRHKCMVIAGDKSPVLGELL